MAPSPTTETGIKSERMAQRSLAREEIKAEPGWSARAFGRWVRLDLVDLENGQIYEVKTGSLFHIVESTASGLDQAERQAALIGRSVGLRNVKSGEEVPQFRARGVTWISVAAGGKAGFGPKAAKRLSGLGISMKTIG